MSTNQTRPEEAIESLEDARAAITFALTVTGHHREFIRGVLGAESLHGCLRPGAPLWVHRCGARDYLRTVPSEAKK